MYLHRTPFTKKQFESLIGDDFMAKSILEGIVYDKTTPEGIVYAASICYPQTDLYVPISITISPDGKISMKKEELLEEVYDEDTRIDKIFFIIVIFLVSIISFGTISHCK